MLVTGSTKTTALKQSVLKIYENISAHEKISSSLETEIFCLQNYTRDNRGDGSTDSFLPAQPYV